MDQFGNQFQFGTQLQFGTQFQSLELQNQLQTSRENSRKNKYLYFLLIHLAFANGDDEGPGRANYLFDYTLNRQ